MFHLVLDLVTTKGDYCLMMSTIKVYLKILIFFQ